MKQKALPAGTAWALGGGVKKMNRFGFTEKNVLMDNGPHLSVFQWYQMKVEKTGHFLFAVDHLVKCITCMIYACQISFPKQPNLQL